MECQGGHEGEDGDGTPENHGNRDSEVEPLAKLNRSRSKACVLDGISSHQDCLRHGLSVWSGKIHRRRPECAHESRVADDAGEGRAEFDDRLDLAVPATRRTGTALDPSENSTSRPVSQPRTVNNLQVPGTPFSSRSPLSSTSMPDPAMRSTTVLDTRTSPGSATDSTR